MRKFNVRKRASPYFNYSICSEQKLLINCKLELVTEFSFSYFVICLQVLLSINFIFNGEVPSLARYH